MRNTFSYKNHILQNLSKINKIMPVFMKNIFVNSLIETIDERHHDIQSQTSFKIISMYFANPYK